MKIKPPRTQSAQSFFFASLARFAVRPFRITAKRGTVALYPAELVRIAFQLYNSGTYTECSASVYIVEYIVETDCLAYG